MATSTAALGTAIRKAVATAVRERDAPLSAWPEQFPGRWATAARLADMLGRNTSEISYRLHEMVEKGEIISAQPWPAGLRGYQPTIQSQGKESSLFAIPEPMSDERQWIVDELDRWAALHDGLAPRQSDWSKAQDPEGCWPRWNRVAEFFEAEALRTGIRYFIPSRCAVECSCMSGQHYSNEHGDTFCDGCFDCLGRCPYGDSGEWTGPSGWRWALQVAGLGIRTSSQ